MRVHIRRCSSELARGGRLTPGTSLPTHPNAGMSQQSWVSGVGLPIKQWWLRTLALKNHSGE